MNKKSKTYRDSKGYLRFKDSDRLVHRWVAFKSGKRNKSVKFKDAHVHHKDGNKMNNNPKNLEVLSPSEHRYEHWLGFEGVWRAIKYLFVLSIIGLIFFAINSVNGLTLSFEQEKQIALSNIPVTCGTNYDSFTSEISEYEILNENEVTSSIIKLEYDKYVYQFNKENGLMTSIWKRGNNEGDGYYLLERC